MRTGFDLSPLQMLLLVMLRPSRLDQEPAESEIAPLGPKSWRFLALIICPKITAIDQSKWDSPFDPIMNLVSPKYHQTLADPWTCTQIRICVVSLIAIFACQSLTLGEMMLLLGGMRSERLVSAFFFSFNGLALE